MTTFALRPIIWSDGYSTPDDYYIIHDGRIVGRLCRMDFVAKERWCWTQIGLAPTSGPNGGLVDCLDEAKAAFSAAWGRSTQGLHESNSSLHALRLSTGKKKTISMMWADKFAIGSLAITAIVAAILALNPHVYRTTAESIGGAIGLFVVTATALVLPVWLILRITVWVAESFRVGAAFRRARVAPGEEAITRTACWEKREPAG